MPRQLATVSSSVTPVSGWLQASSVGRLFLRVVMLWWQLTLIVGHAAWLELIC
jgi:hypothetical protein